MGRRRKADSYTPAQIVEMLRAVEVAKGEDKTAAQAISEQGISENTYYRWRRQYGEMDKDEVKRLRELEKENARLKKLAADLSLDAIDTVKVYKLQFRREFLFLNGKQNLSLGDCQMRKRVARNEHLEASLCALNLQRLEDREL